MTKTLPTIVLVHGAWHTPPNYQTYIDDLEAKGFTVHCPKLPTCNGSRPPNGTVHDDIALVRSVLVSCIERGERVLLIMHSYGGIVGTDAAQGLDLGTQKAANQPGGVIHLLYLCAYLMVPGHTIWEIVEETGVDKIWSQLIDTAPDGATSPIDSGMAFFSGLEEQSVVDKALANIVCFPTDAFTVVTTGDVWRNVPATYVRTHRDNALPPAYQDILLRRIQEQGVVVDVVEFDTHHSIWISLPDEMVQIALKAAGDERTCSDC